MRTARLTNLMAGLAVGLAVLLGLIGVGSWLVGEWRFASFAAGHVPMAPMTGVLFVMLGLTLAVRIGAPDSRPSRIAASSAAVCALAVAALVLVQSLWPFPLPWDGWLVTAEAEASIPPAGRMSPITAAVFLVSALAVFLRLTRLERHGAWRWASPAAAGAGALGATVVLLSYSAGVPLFYGGETVPMAQMTALAFLALNAGVLLIGTTTELERDVLDHDSVPGAPRPGRVTGLALAALGLTGGLLVVLAGFYYLRGKHSAAREAAVEQLEAIASLKAEQITNWRRERLAEARFLLRTRVVVDDVLALAATPRDSRVRTRVRGWVDPIKGGDRYESVLILDARSHVLLSVPEGAGTTHLPTPEVLRRAMGGHGEVLGDLHREPGSGIHIDLLVPIRSAPGDAATAAIVLRLDPGQFLFPLLRSWPVRAATAESFLVRREGDEVVYLSEVRGDPAAPPLTRRHSIQESMLPAALALRGGAASHEAIDDRGVPVLFSTRSIPDSPWVLVSQLEQSEAFVATRREAWLAAALVALLLLSLGQTAAFIWRQRHAAFLRRALVAEQAHKATSERLALITKHANDVVLLIDQDLRVVEANDRVREVYGRSREAMCRLAVSDLRADSTGEEMRALFDASARGEGTVFETLHRREDGTVFPVEVSARPVNIEGRRYVLSIVRDITERKTHETEIGRLNRLYAARSHVNQSIVHATERVALLGEVCRSLVEHGGFPMAWVGWRDDLTSVVTPEAEFGDTSAYLADIQVRTDETVLGQGPTGTAIRENRTVVSNDFHHDPGTEPWREAALKAGFMASIALPIRVSGVARGALTVYAREPGYFGASEIALLEEASADIQFGLENLERETRRQEADKALHASLREKEALLKEVHHRVKNNLQVIMSLLRLEASRSGEAGTRLVLREMQGRIRSMALLHETLYRSGNFARVDLADYLRDLVNQLFRSQSADPSGARLVLDLAPVRLDIDHAIPCGLIVNELVTNALKHGLKDGRTGEVRVSLGVGPGGRVTIEVGDSGPGLPADFEARREKSLGLQLVSDLARQLGGEFEIAAQPKMVFRVVFGLPSQDTGPIERPAF